MPFWGAGSTSVLNYLRECRCVSILMVIFYLSEYTTQVIRWHHWDETFSASFYNDAVYRVAIITQMSINVACVIILSLWLILHRIRLHWSHVTPLMCCMLLAVLFACQFIACVYHTSEINSSDNIAYLTQAVLDLFACGFVILYFTFDRDVDEGGRSRHENLGLIVVACVLDVFHIIIDFAINIIHETSMCSFSIYYLISIVENILLFEILHLAIDVIRHTGAIRAIISDQGTANQQQVADERTPLHNSV